MPHVHSISSDDDDLDADEWEVHEPDGEERRAIPWIPIAAAGGAVLLLIIIGVLLFGGGSSKSSTPTTTVATAPAGEPLAATDPRVVAAQAALDAWGKFEGSGKVAVLAGTMDPNGPQYKALAARAASIKPGTLPFTVILTNPRALPGGDNGDQIVQGDIVWKRGDKPQETVSWNLALRTKSDGSGLWLWTARKATDTSTGGTAAPAGDFCAAAKVAEGVPTNNDLNARLQASSSDSDQLATILDVLTQRANASAAMAAAAPADIRDKANAVAAGDAVYLAQIKKVAKLKDFAAADKKANADKTYQAGLAALGDVTTYTKSKCGANIDRGR